MTFALERESPLEPRTYVVLVSGTLNPPHIGHVELGLHSARQLKAAGHSVSAICFVPVHDNYLHNKVSLKRKRGEEITPDTMCFPMAKRCEMLRDLIKSGNAPEGDICHVLDYEHTSGSDLLELSPHYWAPKLPGGYLKTVPTGSLVSHFANNSAHMKTGVRLAAVFGVDNLAGMAFWNNPAAMLEAADLVLVGRAMSEVTFPKDPSGLLDCVKHLDLRVAVPISFEKKVLFGDKTGTYVNRGGKGQGAMFMFPALEGEAEGLSSTNIRDAAAAFLKTMKVHGYSSAALSPVLAGAAGAAEALDAMEASASKRGELVRPRTSP